MMRSPLVPMMKVDGRLVVANWGATKVSDLLTEDDFSTLEESENTVTYVDGVRAKVPVLSLKANGCTCYYVRLEDLPQ